MNRIHRHTIAAFFCAAALLLAQTPPAAQQIGDPAARGTQATPPNAAGRGGRGGRGGFPQHTRQLASQDVLARGKALYDTNCASCHAADLRGKDEMPRLLRSGIALRDQHGELIGPAVAKHTPAINLVAADNSAIAEYIHSVLATTGGQGSPPFRNASASQLNILVGNAKAGEAYFDKACANCHSAVGDMRGIASKYPDPRSLQNAWFAGMNGANPFAGGGRGGGGVGNPVTVTMPDGQKFEGKVVRKDDYLVILTLADGTRKSISRDGDVPRVEVKDPSEAHKNMAIALDDPENKNLHDVTAYLATLK